MQIRKLVLADVKEVNAIRNYYISNTNYIFRRCEKDYQSDIDFFEELLDKNYPVVVAVDDTTIVGFAYLYPFRSLDGYDRTMELSIYLEKDCKQNGIGSKLLEEIEKLSIDKYHAIISVITSDNTGSIDFHYKKGFELVGEMKEVGFVNNKYLNATFMQKNLYKNDLV